MPDNSAQQTFKALLEHYYHAWFRFHPEEAIQVGVPGYEEGLRAYSDDDIGALISLNEKAQRAKTEACEFSLQLEPGADCELPERRSLPFAFNQHGRGKGGRNSLEKLQQVKALGGLIDAGYQPFLPL